MHMKLYHGTSMQALPKILKNGIRPRSEEIVGNWEEFPSKTGYVYLTVAYALYFAITATKEDKNDERKFVIVEIESDHLRQNRLCPDEDFIGQVRSHQEEISLKKATEECNPLDYRTHWKLSLEKMGNCCYYGKVPVTAITRYAIIDTKINWKLTFLGLDPTISIMNFRLMSKKYTSLISHIFDGTEIYDEQALFQPWKDIDDVPGLEFANKMFADAKAFQKEMQDLRGSSIQVFKY